MTTARISTPPLPPTNPRRTNPTSLTIVLKLGTTSICDEQTHLPKLSTLSLLVETIVHLRSAGHKIVVVSSGAVGVGLRRLGLDRRPKHLAVKQAVAAVGQGRLMALYDGLFAQFDVPIAQVLLTRENLAERTQYLNACNTFKELLLMNVVPIVNENDTVSNAEIRFGDNDTLSAITAGMVNADYLFLMTDVDCLYTDNPKTNPDARPVRVVEDVGELRDKVTVSSPGSHLGTGGMVTKLVAADLATAAGCTTIITLSHPPLIPTILAEIQSHTPNTPFCPTHGTHFLPRPNAMMDRKWWILHGLKSFGAIYLDKGAVRAVMNRHRSSLFAAGVARVEGTFNAQQCVRLLTIIHKNDTETVIEIGKGLVNYSFAECLRIKGHKSSEIEGLLGYVDSGCVVHRDNLVITNRDVDVESIVLEGVSRRGSEEDNSPVASG
ncbi:glutamate 5-kinase [Spizellomyces punctatus DAOM BR117]|uniref:Glutamate 5-kinase n=1 Tax=Spizellomyces punctatus (strain DAOM BR117) TaxID=645134 RepID=A0A0L0HJJ5_SPIPD|nr:glutamate 5-kinase [Spizellomyces punctatus DAOM BR117]KND01626.1 glutamate 5-kinase [Spizellomyces punctatus DAOM BR117]|eukprot:XP_016609665.1 glutamate 5-kinase [Spizellomyces punctatus DAOM BR117]